MKGISKYFKTFCPRWCIRLFLSALTRLAFAPITERKLQKWKLFGDLRTEESRLRASECFGWLGLTNTTLPSTPTKAISAFFVRNLFFYSRHSISSALSLFRRRQIYVWLHRRRWRRPFFLRSTYPPTNHFDESNKKAVLCLRIIKLGKWVPNWYIELISALRYFCVPGQAVWSK